MDAVCTSHEQIPLTFSFPIVINFKFPLQSQQKYCIFSNNSPARYFFVVKGGTYSREATYSREGGGGGALNTNAWFNRAVVGQEWYPNTT